MAIIWILSNKMKKKGFTLIELLVSLAIISLLLGSLGLIFSFNMNILSSSYKEEKEYKQASVAALYIEDKIRRAEKIVEIEGRDHMNFRLYVDSPNEKTPKSTIEFSLENRPGEEDGYKVLYAYIDSERTSTDKEGKVRIALLKDIFIYYDKELQTMEMVINNSSPNTRIKTFIDLEARQ